MEKDNGAMSFTEGAIYETNLSNAILIEKLEKENEELSIWKEEAMEVMSQFQMQEIGKVLNIELGDSISKQTLPAIKKLKADKKELLEALEILVKTSFKYEFPDNIQKAISLIQKHKL